MKTIFNTKTLIPIVLMVSIVFTPFQKALGQTQSKNNDVPTEPVKTYKNNAASMDVAKTDVSFSIRHTKDPEVADDESHNNTQTFLIDYTDKNSEKAIKYAQQIGQAFKGAGVPSVVYLHNNLERSESDNIYMSAFLNGEPVVYSPGGSEILTPKELKDSMGKIKQNYEDTIRASVQKTVTLKDGLE